MDKTIARIELSVQNKVDMSIHQHKSKNQDIATFCYGKYSVHPVTKILIVPEQTLNRVSGCIEMPTVIDLNDLSFNHRPFKSQIGGNVWKKCVSREGLLSSWPLGGENFGTLKEMVVGPPHTAYRRSLQTTLCGCEGN